MNQGRPIDTLSKYVHVSLSCGSEVVTDDWLIEHISEKPFLVISGLAGSGKSMFMKYLTICKFEQPGDGIPLFIELRKLNALKNIDLLTFIRVFCNPPERVVSKEYFELGLQIGAFQLVLDGFDEVSHDARLTVQDQILRIRESFPKTKIIVSSRPDDTRFGSWQKFFTFNVEPLSKPQSLKLISGLDYDAGVKKVFSSS